MNTQIFVGTFKKYHRHIPLHKESLPSNHVLGGRIGKLVGRSYGTHYQCQVNPIMLLYIVLCAYVSGGRMV